MKRFILCTIAVMLTLNTCLADDLRIDKEAKYQKQIMQIGFRILNANQIEKRMTFYYSNEKKVDAGIKKGSKLIYINKGIIPFADSDDELAAILSRQIAYGLDSHSGFFKRMFMKTYHSRYVVKEDKKSVDLMVNAGYNPVALIVILNKTASEPDFFDDWYKRTRPKGSKRLVYIYEYIYSKYPAYLADNDYQHNMYYQNFLLTSINERQLIKEKYKNLYIKPVNNKK